MRCSHDKTEQQNNGWKMKMVCRRLPIVQTALIGAIACLPGMGGVAIADGIASTDSPSSAIDEQELVIDPSAYEEYPDFERLQQELEQANFTVKIELPPRRGSYGVLELATRTVWINPVVFELGIAQHTLVHEAVHAAQLCGSHEELSPLALGLEPPLVVQPYFMRYSGIRRLVEAEAYTVQALDNSVEYVIDLLNTHCP